MKNRNGILVSTALALLMAAAPAGASAAAPQAGAQDGARAADSFALMLAQTDERELRRQERRGQQAERRGVQEAPEGRQAGEEAGGERRQGQRPQRAERGGQERRERAERREERREQVEQQEERRGQQAERRRAQEAPEGRQAGEEAAGERRQGQRPQRAERGGEERRERAEQREGQHQERIEQQERRGQQAERRGAREAPEGRQAGEEAAGERRQEQRPQRAERREEQRGEQAERREERREQVEQRGDERRERVEQQEERRRERAERRRTEQPGEAAGETAEGRRVRPEAEARRGVTLPRSAAPAGREEEGSARRGEEGALPETDSAAQQRIDVREVTSATAEEGRRIDREAFRQRVLRERPEGAEVVREIGDRVVLQIENRTIVQSPDYDRLHYRARDVYYEELPRGRTREVVIRENGARVITIRNRYGDIIRRSRIAPDGREYVLVYAGDRRERLDRSVWVDPGRELPPLHLTIPMSEYVLEAEEVQDPEVYYRFLDEPPVEPVEQLYTIDDVRYSARIRDKVRRVDLDTINFEFGSASISDSEISKLEAVASAMQRLLEDNPGETFLIEGHTDAVGSEVANLALSDERASMVATALTRVFEIPPENLVAQGYGEQYLKVGTQAPERENRRVAIRRITPLVTPVASAR